MKRYFPWIFFICILLTVAFPSFRPVQQEPSGITFLIADETRTIINDIMAVVGLKANFSVMPAKVPGAVATIHKGKRYISYNPEYISKINKATGNNWAAVSILAHEIGHHLNGHTLGTSGSLPATELEADEFSGFVLQKMGATLQEAQAAMKIAGKHKAGKTHPAKKDRLLAITKGWKNAGGTITDITKYSQQAPASAETALGSSNLPLQDVADTLKNSKAENKHIIAHIDFPADRVAKYFITSRFNVVKTLNGQVFVLGKMILTNNEEYPYILKNEKSSLYIDRDGNILTTNLEPAGYITFNG